MGLQTNEAGLDILIGPSSFGTVGFSRLCLGIRVPPANLSGPSPRPNPAKFLGVPEIITCS